MCPLGACTRRTTLDERPRRTLPASLKQIVPAPPIPTDQTKLAASLLLWMRVSLAWTGVMTIGYAAIACAWLIAMAFGADAIPDPGGPAVMMALFLTGGAAWSLTRTHHTWIMTKAVEAGTLRPDFSGTDAAEGRKWLRRETITIFFPLMCSPVSIVVLLVVLGIRTQAKQPSGTAPAATGAPELPSVFKDPFQSTFSWSQRQVPHSDA